MSAEPLTPYVPPHALRVWVDRERLFVAYPAANQGADFIVAYERNANGMTCALGAMIKAYDDRHPLPRTSAPTIVAAPNQRKHTRSGPALSDDDKRRALEALIAVGILPASAGN